jgi:hypothetical protein
MARQCAFCGSTEKISREHVWPRWASGHLAGDDTFTFYRHFVGDGFALQEPERWAHKPFDLTVKAVCGSCNNGWMAQLESDAKEALFSSAFAGRGRVLHRGGQRTLAAWALKTAMVVEQTNASARRGIPYAEYSQLRTRGEPSDRVRVWVASYSGTLAVALGLPFGADIDMDAGPNRERGERDVWGSTLLFGPVVFQVIGTHVDAVLGGLEMATANTHQVWPTRESFTWMPRPGLDDGTVMQLHDGYLAWLPAVIANQRSRASQSGAGQ